MCWSFLAVNPARPRSAGFKSQGFCNDTKMCEPSKPCPRLTPCYPGDTHIEALINDIYMTFMIWSMMAFWLMLS